MNQTELLEQDSKPYEETNGIEDNGEQTDYSDEMQLYENMHPTTPAQIDKHLEFIHFDKNGCMILGSSNLTGRYWGGSLWAFEDPDLAPNVEKCKAGIEFTAGLTTGIILDSGRVIVGQDAGIIESLTIETSPDIIPHFISEKKVDDHAYSISSLKLTADQKNMVSASHDMSIRIWDPENFSCVTVFTPAHTQDIMSLDTHSTNPKIFLSASLDGNVLLWDLRNPRPASCVFRDVDDPPSCVCFLPEFPDSYLVGTFSGKICLRKTDTLTHSINEMQHFKRRIFRIVPNPYKTDRFAICADESKVIVLQMEGESFKLVYSNDDHSDFVRGLAWKDANTLYSCGWDKKVLKHVLQS